MIFSHAFLRKNQKCYFYFYPHLNGFLPLLSVTSEQGFCLIFVFKWSPLFWEELAYILLYSIVKHGNCTLSSYSCLGDTASDHRKYFEFWPSQIDIKFVLCHLSCFLLVLFSTFQLLGLFHNLDVKASMHICDSIKLHFLLVVFLKKRFIILDFTSSRYQIITCIVMFYTIVFILHIIWIELSFHSFRAQCQICL